MGSSDKVFARGQNHDRVAKDEFESLPPALPAGADDGGDPLSEITAVQRMLSATSGSLLTGLLVTPLDVVRVRLQSQPAPQPRPLRADLRKLAASSPSAFRPAGLGVTACCREVFFSNNSNETCVFEPKLAPARAGGPAVVDCAVEQTQQRTINSTLDGLRKIARNEGLLTLWRGLSPTLVMAVPGNIIYFTGYEWLRYDRMSPISRRVKDDYAPLVAGSVARILAAAAVSPIELFRTRLQASSGASSTGHVSDTFRGIREMIGLHGYRSLWRGLTLTLWRDVPFSGMYWWGYETIRARLTDMRDRRRGGPLEVEDGQLRRQARRRSQSRGTHTDLFTDSFVAGALSGALASIATMPFDVGKTRTQVYQESGKSPVEKAAKVATAPEERSMVRLLWHIYCNEGAAGLFRGWIPRTLKVAPACAIMISSYEVGKRVFRGVNERAAMQQASTPGPA